MVMPSVDLKEAARSLLGLDLTRSQLAAFEWYSQELQSWNERVNLTAITSPSEITVKHFLDSLTCLKAMNPHEGDRLVDVGTGAGFPGLPLKIVCPQLKVLLVEATEKKADFCRHVVQGLGLQSVQVVHARAEDLGQDQQYREQHAWAVARAVAGLSTLAEYLLPLVKIGGRAIAQKGETGPAEAHQAEAAIERLGGHLRRLRPVELPGVADTRYLVTMDKVAATPEAFPRRTGLPAKRPLGS